MQRGLYWTRSRTSDHRHMRRPPSVRHDIFIALMSNSFHRDVDVDSLASLTWSRPRTVQAHVTGVAERLVPPNRLALRSRVVGVRCPASAVAVPTRPGVLLFHPNPLAAEHCLLGFIHETRDAGLAIFPTIRYLCFRR